MHHVVVALPVPLRYTAQLLRQDGAQQIGRAVLFASIVGFDAFEQHISELVVATGVDKQRLNQIVTVGRQAVSTASLRVREQHLVSRALLREFCTPDARGQDKLLAWAIQYGKAKSTGPGGVAKRDHFVKIDSQETEHTWGRVEQAMPAALAAARTRRIFEKPKHVAVIKEAVALHFARSLDVLDTQEVLLRQALAARRAEYLRNWPLMEALYLMKHGLYPPAGDRFREEIADDLLSQATQLVDSGVLFRLRVVDLFEKARAMASWMGLRILRPRRGEFLIGDVPVIPIDETRGAFGLSGGVAFGDATMIVLPLGPRRLAVLVRGPDGFDVIPKSRVSQLNALQVASAKTHVVMRPGSGLEAEIRAVRPPFAKALEATKLAGSPCGSVGEASGEAGFEPAGGLVYVGGDVIPPGRATSAANAPTRWSSARRPPPDGSRA